MKKIISWNVNGLRACLKKGFYDFLASENPDVLCLQEIKATESDLKPLLSNLTGYEIYINSAEKKGYSGVSVFTKIKPNYVKNEINLKKYDVEGRILELGFDDFILFNVYFPNGQKDDERLQYKLSFYKDFFDYCDELKLDGKKLIICGDYNTAHKEIDLARPKENENYSGFLPIERKCLDKLVEADYVDAFRYFDNSPDKYTWWSYKFDARAKNIGWRIDYFFITKNLINMLNNSYILNKISGSDHCPICLEINI